MTYGFGLKRFPWDKTKLRRSSIRTPWYLSIRYGFTSYKFNDDLTKDLVKANYQRTQSFYVGHYITQKMAYEFGLQSSEFVFSTPSVSNNNFSLQRQRLLSVPFAMRYDLIQTDRLTLYGKGIFSTDFRLKPASPFNTSGTGFITDNNNLLLSAGAEAGIDFRVFSGVNVGVVGKYNQAFSKAAQYQYPELTAQNEVEFTDINLKNTYFSWGVELKYLFNRQKKEDIIQY
jgi:hypothetical protein